MACTEATQSRCWQRSSVQPDTPYIRFVENTPWLHTRQARGVGLMDIRKVLATNLRRRRHEVGMSQEELAHRAEVDRTYVSSLERCIYGASIDVVDRLATVLGTDASELLKRR